MKKNPAEKEGREWGVCWGGGGGGHGRLSRRKEGGREGQGSGWREEQVQRPRGRSRHCILEVQRWLLCSELREQGEGVQETANLL